MKAKPKSKFETITIQKTGIAAICKRCDHHWNYFGTKEWANCPVCRTTVRFGPWKK